MSSSLSRDDSSAEEGDNEFTPTQAIFPKTNDGGCSSNSLDDVGQQLLKRMNALEAHQRQNEAETKEMFDQQIKQLQTNQKAFFCEWEKKQQKQEEKWTNALAAQLETILGRMGKIEEKQQQKYEESEKSFNDQFSQLHNEQKTILGKISDLEKQHQMALANQMKTDFDVKFNCWDANTCHCDLEISGSNCTMVHHKGNTYGWLTVFAKYSILRSAVGQLNIFYFELNVKNLSRFVTFGFAVKHQTPLDEYIVKRTGTYAYEDDGNIWINGKQKDGDERFDDGDTVGCGVHLANRQLIFTKNGRRIDATNGFLFSSSADSLFPFVSLWDSDDRIDANFGPKFMFDLSTLC